MSITWKSVGMIIGSILSVVSPTIREALQEFFRNLYREALETDNPLDDFAVRFLCGIFGVSVEKTL